MFSNSPKLFAANHVLHRLLPPRHSPFALISLTINLTVFHYTARSARTHHAPWCTEPDTLDSKKYSIIKDRRNITREFHGSFRPPACLGPAALEGHLEEQTSVACILLLKMGWKTFPGSRLLAQPVKGLVELIGIEPTTSGLQSPRSPS